MIAQREVMKMFIDRSVRESITLFTTPMANLTIDPVTGEKWDDDRGEHMPSESSVLEDLHAWMDLDRGAGGRDADPSTVTYTVLGVLVGFHLLMGQSQPVSLAGVLQVLLLELTPTQREWLGMTGDLSGTRAALIPLAGDKEADIADQLAGRKARTQEYARLAKVAARMFEVIDPSVFHKADTLTKAERGNTRATSRTSRRRKQDAATPARRTRAKMTNALRQAILSTPDHPDRRIDDATSRRNFRRLCSVMNKIVAIIARTAPFGYWGGDTATDETVAITLPRRAGHGTKEHLLTSADPDAYYWPGKNSGDDQDDKNDEAGFGYGVTFLVRAGRPYERRIPEIALGIHIGKPTGGRTEPVRIAHAHAELHGLTSTKRSRRLIADMGYTRLDDWLPFLHDTGYRPVQDYPKHWHRDIAIPDTDAHGQPAATGPRLIAGQIRCPGATGLRADQLLTPHPETTGAESDEGIVNRHRRTLFLDALTMPVKDGPRPVKSPRGRPRDGHTPDTWTVTVQCPAALGLVNCPLVQRHDGLRNPDVPDVPNPPEVADPDLLPRACRQDNVAYQLPLAHAKRLQPFTWGSHQWADAYSTVRSANERYHSQFKHPKSGGVGESWLEMRGIAKAGLLFAIATAVTSENLIRDFRTKHTQPDGNPEFGRREKLRRERQKIIRREQP